MRDHGYRMRGGKRLTIDFKGDLVDRIAVEAERRSTTVSDIVRESVVRFLATADEAAS